MSTDKVEQLNTLYDAYWEEWLKLNPIWATIFGDTRYNDQLADIYAIGHRQQSHDLTVRYLTAVEQIGPPSLQGTDLLNYQYFVYKAHLALEAEEFSEWMIPPIHRILSIDNPVGIVVDFGGGMAEQPFNTVEDYDDWLARGSRVPPLFDTLIANMRQGVVAGVVHPRVLIAKLIPKLNALIAENPEDTRFWKPIKSMPAEFPDTDKQRLAGAFRIMIDVQLMPAYQKLLAFLTDEYLPATRATLGMYELPEGPAWYANKIRQYTSTDLSPEQIHDLGLSEVARIHGEVRQVMNQVNFTGSLHEFYAFMQEDSRFGFANESAMLAYFQALENRINERIPTLFSLMPKAAFEIRPIEAYRAPSMGKGVYYRASADGTRPGIFYLNTYNPINRETWDAERLYLHEAIPGHHFQQSLQQEMSQLPQFRRFAKEAAFGEGWALYSESLGRELGVYTDPYNYFAALQGELQRAIRLAADTGLHSMGWSRQQTIQYILDNSSASQSTAENEVDRYIGNPGGVLAYKIGQLKFQELRGRAEKAHGTRFDIREFHAQVLQCGQVPLSLLETTIHRWIASKKPEPSK